MKIHRFDTFNESYKAPKFAVQPAPGDTGYEYVRKAYGVTKGPKKKNKDQKTEEIAESASQVKYFIDKFQAKMPNTGPGAAAGWVEGITELSNGDKAKVWNGIQKFIDKKHKDPTDISIYDWMPK